MLSSQHLSPRRKNNPSATRTRIGDAAYALFQSHGYSRTTMQEIAQAARVTSGAMHHHFPTKKDIGLSVIKEQVSRMVRQTWVDPIKVSTNSLATVVEIVNDLARELDDRGRVQGCPLNNLTLELAASDPDFRHALQLLFRDWRAALADAIRSERPSPTCHPRQAESVATFVFAAYSGAMAMAKAEQSGAPLRVCAQELKRLFVADRSAGFATA